VAGGIYLHLHANGWSRNPAGRWVWQRLRDAVEGATKEAATDALKRAARTFGNVFGLALYDKSRANVQAPPEVEPETVQVMRKQIRDCQTIIALKQWKRDHGLAADATGYGPALVADWNARKIEVEAMDRVAA
jgi:hypothetical protein